jgi:hypothetical protein
MLPFTMEPPDNTLTAAHLGNSGRHKKFGCDKGD